MSIFVETLDSGCERSVQDSASYHQDDGGDDATNSR